MPTYVFLSSLIRGCGFVTRSACPHMYINLRLSFTHLPCTDRRGWMARARRRRKHVPGRIVRVCRVPTRTDYGEQHDEERHDELPARCVAVLAELLAEGGHAHFVTVRQLIYRLPRKLLPSILFRLRCDQRLPGHAGVCCPRLRGGRRGRRRFCGRVP
jgi:hypothetical protein